MTKVVLTCVGLFMAVSILVACIVGPSSQEDELPFKSSPGVRTENGVLSCEFVRHHRMGDWAELDREHVSTHELVDRIVACTR